MTIPDFVWFYPLLKYELKEFIHAKPYSHALLWIRFYLRINEWTGGARLPRTPAEGLAEDAPYLFVNGEDHMGIKIHRS